MVIKELKQINTLASIVFKEFGIEDMHDKFMIRDYTEFIWNIEDEVRITYQPIEDVGEEDRWPVEALIHFYQKLGKQAFRKYGYSGFFITDDEGFHFFGIFSDDKKLKE